MKKTHPPQCQTVPTCLDQLKGLKVLVVGGNCQRKKARKTRLKLRLKQVDWVPTLESKPSGSSYIKSLATAGPNLVVALIGFMRHQQVHDIQNYCRINGIPFMPLYRSFSATQVAHSWEKQHFSR